MKQILFISQVFYPDTSSTSQLFSSLLETFCKKGYLFEIWTNRSSAQLVSNFWTKHANFIKRIGPINKNKDKLFNRFINYFLFLVSVAIRLPFISDCSRIIAVTNPPLLPIIVWIISLMSRWKYSLIIHDLYPEGLERVGLLKNKGIISILWHRLNKCAFTKAESIEVLGRDMKKLIISKYSISNNKVHWVPHWSAHNPGPVIKVNESKFLTKKNLHKKWVAQYSGNMGLWHDIENIVHAAYILREHANIHFLMVGNGMRKVDAKKLSIRLGLKNITWMEPVLLSDLEQMLSACNISLISQREGLVGIAVPCKIYGILASGRPIVAAVPKDCEVAMVVNEEACGEVVPPHDPKLLAQSILRLHENPRTTKEMGKRARDAYENKYTIAHAVRRFENTWGLVPPRQS